MKKIKKIEKELKELNEKIKTPKNTKGHWIKNIW